VHSDPTNRELFTPAKYHVIRRLYSLLRMQMSFYCYENDKAVTLSRVESFVHVYHETRSNTLSSSRRTSWRRESQRGRHTKCRTILELFCSWLGKDRHRLSERFPPCPFPPVPANFENISGIFKTMMMMMPFESHQKLSHETMSPTT
jgi:hypothetical protein